MTLDEIDAAIAAAQAHLKDLRRARQSLIRRSRLSHRARQIAASLTLLDQLRASPGLLIADKSLRAHARRVGRA